MNFSRSKAEVSSLLPHRTEVRRSTSRRVRSEGWSSAPRGDESAGENLIDLGRHKSGYVPPYFLKYGHAMRHALHRAVLRVAIRLAIFVKRGSRVFVPMSRMKRETKGDGIDPVMFRQRNVSIPLLSNAFTGHALRQRPQWVQSCTGLRRAVPVGISRSVRTAPRPRRIPYRGDRRRPLSPISPCRRPGHSV